MALAESLQRLIDAAADRLRQLDEPVLLDGLSDPCYDILAEADLRILDGLLVNEASVAQVEEVRNDLGRADVDRHTENARFSAVGLNVDEGVTVPRDGCLEITVVQRVCELAQHREWHSGDAELLTDALQIAARIVERRRRQPDDLLDHSGVHLAAGQAGRCEDLPSTMDRAHLDAYARGQRLGLARQPPALLEALGRHLAKLGLCRPSEFSGTQPDETLTTRPAAAAVHGDGRRTCRKRGQEHIAALDLDGQPNRLYEDLRHGRSPSHREEHDSERGTELSLAAPARPRPAGSR